MWVRMRVCEASRLEKLLLQPLNRALSPSCSTRPAPHSGLTLTHAQLQLGHTDRYDLYGHWLEPNSTPAFFSVFVFTPSTSSSPLSTITPPCFYYTTHTHKSTKYPLLLCELVIPPHPAVLLSVTLPPAMLAHFCLPRLISPSHTKHNRCLFPVSPVLSCSLPLITFNLDMCYQLLSASLIVLWGLISVKPFAIHSNF